MAEPISPTASRDEEFLPHNSKTKNNHDDDDTLNILWICMLVVYTH